MEVDRHEAAVGRLQQRQPLRALGDVERLHHEIDVRPWMFRSRQPHHGRGPDRRHVERAALGVDGRPAPGGAPDQAWHLHRAACTTGPLIDEGRRREEWPRDIPGQDRFGFPAQLGGEINQIADGDPLLRERRRLGGKRLGGRVPLSGHITRCHRTLLDRPDRLAGHAVEHVGEALLADDRDRLDVAAVHGDVDQVRRRREVVVPDPVMHRLKVPDAFAGPGVETDQALGEQVVTGPVSAVVVVGRCGERQVDVAQLLVGARPGPHVRVAGVLPRCTVLIRAGEPGLVARLALLGHRVEKPELLAGPDVEPPDIAGRHLLASRHRLVDEVGHGRADDHDVVDDQRRRPPGELRHGSGVVALGQVDFPIDSEVGVSRTGACVQRDQGRPDDGDDPSILALPILPVRDPATRAATAGRAVGQRIEPDDLTGGRVERGHRPQRRAHIQPSVGHQRCVLHHRRRPHRTALPDRVGDRRLAPDDPEVAGVVRRDLVERRISRAGGVGAVGAPFSGLRRGDRARHEREQQEGRDA